MAIYVRIDVIAKMRLKNTWSFYIMELKSERSEIDLMVDISESGDEALAKCKYVHENFGIKCKYYETGQDTFKKILETTKDLDVNDTAKNSICLPALELRNEKISTAS